MARFLQSLMKSSPYMTNALRPKISSIISTKSMTSFRSCSTWSESDFNVVADQTLTEIQDLIDIIDEASEAELDLAFSQGVLKIGVPDIGTWVLNKQGPNRQMWFSSPISGPMRFEYKSDKKVWENTRDGTELFKILCHEMKDATGVEVY